MASSGCKTRLDSERCRANISLWGRVLVCAQREQIWARTASLSVDRARPPGPAPAPSRRRSVAQPGGTRPTPPTAVRPFRTSRHRSQCPRRRSPRRTASAPAAFVRTRTPPGRNAEPGRELFDGPGHHVVVRPQALTLTVDDTCVPQDLEVVRDRRLPHVEQRRQLTHAHLARVPAQHIDQLHPDGVAQRLGDRRHALGLSALDIWVDDRFATRLPRWSFLLG